MGTAGPSRSHIKFFPNFAAVIPDWPCYPKTEQAAQIGNSMKLDTTGQYLTIGRKRRRPRVPEPSPEIARSRKYGNLLQKSMRSTIRQRKNMKPTP
jgi:hypothetical protein